MLTLRRPAGRREDPVVDRDTPATEGPPAKRPADAALAKPALSNVRRLKDIENTELA